MKVAEIIIEQVKKDPTSKLGLATGGTAQQVYPHLVEAYKQGRVSFSQITTVNLDEYLGIRPDSEQSYRRCMDDWFFDRTDIDKAKTYVPSGLNPPNMEIKTFNEKLYGDKPIDLQLIGVGVNGHIGFNEPAAELIAGVHIEKLTESTIQANARFFASESDVPREAITMGIGDILKAKRIVLIATGENKAKVIGKLLADDTVTTSVPATLLKVHPDVTVVIDEALAAMAGYKGCC